MSLRLRVSVPIPSGEGESRPEHIYTDIRLLAGPREVTEALEGDEVRLGDLTLEVGGRFLGAAQRRDLPPAAVPYAPALAGYRAVLERDDGTPLFDGVIPRAEIAHDVLPDAWAFPLIAAAQADLWERLEALRLSDLDGAALAYDEVPFLEYIDAEGAYTANTGTARQRVGYVRGPEDIPGAPRHRWYRLDSVVRAVFAEAGVSLVGGLPLVTYGVAYLDGDDTEQTVERPATLSIMGLGLYGRGETGAAYGIPYGPDAITLPDWSGAELIERACALCGWRLVARYATYPSEEVEVEVLPVMAPMPDPALLPALDDRVAEGGYTRRAEAGPSGLAVRHSGPARARTPGLRMLRQPGSSAVAEGYIPAPPVPWFAQAADVWYPQRDASREIDGDVLEAEDQVETGFELPALGWRAHLGGETDAAGTLGVVERGVVDPRHSTYRERVYYGLPLIRGVNQYDPPPPPEHCYVGVVFHAPGASYPALLWAREPTRPVPAQERLVHEAAAAAVWRRRPVAAVEIADGDFNVQEVAFRVGDPRAGCALEGEAWMVRERRLDLDSSRAGLVLEYPAEETAPEFPPRIAAVEGLSARLERATVRVEGGGGTRADIDFVTVEWAPPPFSACGYTLYEVAWQADETHAWRSVTTRATAYRMLRNPDWGDALSVRVRAFGPAAGPVPFFGPARYTTADLTTVTNDE